MLTIAYYTLGCKVNQYETEKIREALERAGFATVPFSSPADAYVINTCSVTHVADRKSRAAVHRALRANPMLMSLSQDVTRSSTRRGFVRSMEWIW